VGKKRVIEQKPRGSVDGPTHSDDVIVVTDPAYCPGSRSPSAKPHRLQPKDGHATRHLRARSPDQPLGQVPYPCPSAQAGFIQNLPQRSINCGPCRSPVPGRAGAYYAPSGQDARRLPPRSRAISTKPAGSAMDSTPGYSSAIAAGATASGAVLFQAAWMRRHLGEGEDAYRGTR